MEHIQDNRVSRRGVLIGLGALLVVILANRLCADKSDRRNKWLERTGRDKAKDGNGKGWDDEY